MKYLFVVLSNQPYNLPLKTNKYHVATILAKKGHKVIFVDPPLRFKALKNFMKTWAFNLNFVELFSSFTYINSLYLYKPANFFNFYPISRLNTKLHSSAIIKKIKYIKKIEPDIKTIMYVYHFDFPDLEIFLNKITYDLMIYDCVDEYTAFPEYAMRSKTNKGFIKLLQTFDEILRIRFNQNYLSGVDWVNFRESYLAKKSDLIFVSAPGLVKKFEKYNKVYFLPNACVPEKFDIDKSNTPEPKDLREIPHPRIGYSGAIDSYKNNIQLIERIARTYSDYSFIMIGPEKLSDPCLNLSILKTMKNVYFLGTKEWSDTPNYFVHFDVYFIPYNLNDYTIKGCFPVKYFESLAAGLPTVVTNLPAYEDYDVDGLISKTDDEFIKNIKFALEYNTKDRVLKRKKLAYKNSWEGKVNKQLDLIDEKLNKTD